MDLDEKLGCVTTLILIVILVLVIGWIIAAAAHEDGIRRQCLECGYPNYTTHGKAGYCVRVGSVVVPVEEACQR